jgi:hypothetical protein
MLIQAIPGVQNNPDASAPVALRAGKQGEAMVSELHGRYYESSYRKQRFGGSITGQVTTVGVATTYTGLCLSNPVTSPVNLVIDKVGVAFLVAFAAASAVGIMTGYNASTNVTHTTPAVVRNKRLDGAVGYGLLDSAATLPTAPVLDTVLFAGLTGAITTAPAADNIFDMEGTIVLPPGAYAAIYTSTVSGAASMSASFSWEEVPI